MEKYTGGLKDEGAVGMYNLLSELNQVIREKNPGKLQDVVEKYMQSQDLAKDMSWMPWLAYGAKSLVTQWSWDPAGQMAEALKVALKDAGKENLVWVAETLKISADSLVIKKFDPATLGVGKLPLPPSGGDGGGDEEPERRPGVS